MLNLSQNRRIRLRPFADRDGGFVINEGLARTIVVQLSRLVGKSARWHKLATASINCGLRTGWLAGPALSLQSAGVFQGTVDGWSRVESRWTLCAPCRLMRPLPSCRA